jgi:hypothetical protein
LVDGAQSVSHMRVDVRALDADFFVFSGHKIFGPTGIGVVYGKRDVLEDMPPWQGGGNMIADVTFERTVYHAPPTRFEAGTGNIADAVGLGAALEYVERIGIDNIGRYEHGLLDYATHHMQGIRGVRLIGTAKEKASVLSFVLDGYSTDEVGKALTRKASRCAPATTARSRSCAASGWRRRFGRRSRSTTPATKSIAWWRWCGSWPGPGDDAAAIVLTAVELKSRIEDENGATPVAPSSWVPSHATSSCRSGRTHRHRRSASSAPWPSRRRRRRS